MGVPTRDLTGRVFGRLTVIEMAERGPRGLAQWRCVCSCGTVKVVRSNNLIHGGTISCGCKRRETNSYGLVHGYCRRGNGAPEWFCWAAMVARCTQPRHAQWRHYGGRGITVCSRWLESFENFLADMGRRPGRGFSLDRIDNDRGYGPGNCRWTTAKVQARNNRRVVLCETSAVLIRYMRRRGSKRSDVAWAFGTTPEAVTSIMRGKSWDGSVAHLGGLS